jgi:hypothetical protein
MRRWLAVLAVAVLFVASAYLWVSTESTLADNDPVPVMQTQIADLESRVATLESMLGIPGRMSFSGTGDSTERTLIAEVGIYAVEFHCSGDEGSARLSWGVDVNLLASFTAPGGRVYFSRPDIDLTIEIFCSGDWRFSLS